MLHEISAIRKPALDMIQKERTVQFSDIKEETKDGRNKASK